MQVLLVGSTGFLGGSLIEKLEQENWEIVAIARSPGNSSKLKSGGKKC